MSFREKFENILNNYISISKDQSTVRDADSLLARPQVYHRIHKTCHTNLA